LLRVEPPEAAVGHHGPLGEAGGAPALQGTKLTVRPGAPQVRVSFRVPRPGIRSTEVHPHVTFVDGERFRDIKEYVSYPSSRGGPASSHRTARRAMSRARALSENRCCHGNGRVNALIRRGSGSCIPRLSPYMAQIRNPYLNQQEHPSRIRRNHLCALIGLAVYPDLCYPG